MVDLATIYLSIGLRDHSDHFNIYPLCCISVDFISHSVYNSKRPKTIKFWKNIV